MTNPFERSLQNDLQKHFESGLQRTLTVRRPEQIDFTSNDYLGLARSQELYTLIQERTERISRTNGSTGSRLLSGNSAYAEETEQKLSGIFRSEAALLFNSGYSANLAVLSSLPKKDDTILYDELSHASLKDGARLSLAKRYSFRHNDLADLEKKIKISSGKVFVVVESIYSMDGDESPIDDLVALRDRDDRIVLVVDEAHSTGIVGPRGGGLAVSKGLEKSIDVRIHTFGKAMGSHGACIAGTGLLRQHLINFARPFIYTTAPSVHSVVSVDCAFDFLEKNIALQDTLRERIRWYQAFMSSGDQQKRFRQ
jgi:8-amino-7-oxononanoate synthase